MPVMKVLAALGIGRLGQGTIANGGGLVGRALLQAVYLVVISRWLGPAGYGLYAGCVAAAILLSPLSGWGANYVLARRAVLAPESTPASWSAAVALVLLTGTILSIALVAFAGAFMDVRVGLAAILLLSISELILLPLVHVAISILTARDRPLPAGTLMCAVPAARLALVASGAVTITEPSLDMVVLLHSLGTAAGVVLALLLVKGIAGRPRRSRAADVVSLAREGTTFTASALISSALLEGDKLLVLHRLGPMALGEYSVAFRAASVLVLPLTALANVSLPRLYLLSEAAEAWRRTATMVCLAGTAAGLLMSLAALGLSSWLVVLFGEEFAGAEVLLVWLAPWPALFGLRSALSACITSRGRQDLRTWFEAATLCLLVASNLLLLPVIGTLGAIASLLAAELALCAAMAIALARMAPQAGKA